MAGGIVECENGHLYCAQCAMDSAPSDFGIRDLVLRSALDEVLNWSGLACLICGVRGPLHRSLVTEGAVGALPVRCGFTTDLGVACLWTGHHNEFHFHKHVFSANDHAGVHHPVGRGTKREVSTLNDNDQPVKQRRHQLTASVEENSEFQITSADLGVVAGSGVPDTSAAGECIGGLVTTTADIHPFDGDESLLDAGLPDIGLQASGGVRATEGLRGAAVADSCFADMGEIAEVHGNDGGILCNVAGGGPTTGGHDNDQEAGDLQANPEGLFAVQQKVPVVHGAKSVGNAAQEDNNSVDDDREPAQNLDNGGVPAGSASVDIHDADGRSIGELYIPPGSFHTVKLALQNAGLIPTPRPSLVDRAAKTIYNAFSSTAQLVSNAFKP